MSDVAGGREHRIRAPAKINLGLRVVGRRPDGYHLLESLFVPLDLADDVSLEIEDASACEVELALVGGSPSLEREDPQRNLAVRAAQAFLAARGVACRVHLRLTKRIPVGAGLGGGSSDAAAVLRALVATLGPLPEGDGHPRLIDLGASLGADVPFFLDPQPAHVSGIGECIEPLAAFPSLPVVLATPDPGLSTADVFREFASRQPALTPEPPSRRMRALLSPPTRSALEGAVREGLLRNDLEPVASRMRPAIRHLRTRLEQLGAWAVGMSGSGPTVFGLFAGPDQAKTAGSQLKVEEEGDVEVHVTRTLGCG